MVIHMPTVSTTTRTKDGPVDAEEDALGNLRAVSNIHIGKTRYINTCIYV